MATAPQQPNLQKKTDAPLPAYRAGRKAYTPVFLFDKTNYRWMIGGVLLILLGFVLMAGGKSPDPHQFLYDEIYSARRITIAPMLILIGFAIEVYAIMRKPADADRDDTVA